MRAHGRWAHIDDRAYQLEEVAQIEVAAGAVKVLVPSLSAKAAAEDRRKPR